MKTKIHFLSYRAQLFLKSHMFETKLVRKIKRHLTFSELFVSLEKYLYEIMWKNMVGAGSRFACWIIKATGTHT